MQPARYQTDIPSSVAQGPHKTFTQESEGSWVKYPRREEEQVYEGVGKGSEGSKWWTRQTSKLEEEGPGLGYKQQFKGTERGYERGFETQRGMQPPSQQGQFVHYPRREEEYSVEGIGKGRSGTFGQPKKQFEREELPSRGFEGGEISRGRRGFEGEKTMPRGQEGQFVHYPHREQEHVVEGIGKGGKGGYRQPQEFQRGEEFQRGQPKQFEREELPSRGFEGEGISRGRRGFEGERPMQRGEGQYVHYPHREQEHVVEGIGKGGRGEYGQPQEFQRGQPKKQFEREELPSRGFEGGEISRGRREFEGEKTMPRGQEGQFVHYPRKEQERVIEGIGKGGKGGYRQPQEFQRGEEEFQRGEEYKQPSFGQRKHKEMIQVPRFTGQYIHYPRREMEHVVEGVGTGRGIPHGKLHMQQAGGRTGPSEEMPYPTERRRFSLDEPALRRRHAGGFQRPMGETREEETSPAEVDPAVLEKKRAMMHDIPAAAKEFSKKRGYYTNVHLSELFVQHHRGSS